VENARVWGGIHFRSDDQDGAAIGRNVANWLEQNFLRPIGRDAAPFSDGSAETGR
jgi:hypothetical protein